MSDTDSVTISLLPVSLSFVHLPRSRLEHFTSQVLRQILQPNPTFLNVTCNEVEVSLFAEHDILQEFHKAARKDARRLRKRERETRVESPQSLRCSRRVKDDWEPVEVSSERWKVLQIDSHSDRLDTSGARVNELSAPIAAAGISIFYQSSYMSDFIFVKESRLAEVMSLLGSAGFDLYLSDPTNLTAQVSSFTSPLLSSNGGDENFPANSMDPHSGRGSFDADGGMVFTRSRSNTSGTTSSGGSHTQTLSGTIASPVDNNHHDQTSEAEQESPPTVTDARRRSARSGSYSPSACEVRLLAPDITCVGLSDDNADVWGLKVVKLIAFPELIFGPSGAPACTERRARPRDPSPALLSALPEEHLHVIALNKGDAGNESDTTTRVAPESPKKDLEGFGSESPTNDMERETAVDDFVAADNSSEGEDSEPRESPKLRHIDTGGAIQVHPHSRSRSASTSSSVSSPDLLVPFFSFTRTPEGSSLAAPVSVLAALFPANERHMVMCSQELDIVDSRNASPERWEEEDGSAEDNEEIAGKDGPPDPEGVLKCLQIDLRKFGLEKHGLVNRFSRTLEENGINHMYSSTYKTANLLIDKAHASRAHALLRSC